MEINFNQSLHNFYGQELTGDDGETLTLGRLAADALLQDADTNTGGKKKYELYKLARLIFKGGKIELNDQYVTLIYDAIGRRCAPLLVGAAYDAMGHNGGHE